MTARERPALPAAPDAQGQGRDLHAEFVRMLPTPPPRSGSSAGACVGSGSWRSRSSWWCSSCKPSLEASPAMRPTPPLYISNVACTDLEPLWLEAQSVPSASMVPCLQFLPVGWTLAKVTVNDGQSVLTLSHDRAGYAALVVRLTAACTPSGAVEGPSRTTGVRHYQRTESRTSSSPSPGMTSSRWVCHQPVAPVNDPNGELAGQAPMCWGSGPARSFRRRSANARTGDYSWIPSKHDEPAGQRGAVPRHRRPDERGSQGVEADVSWRSCAGLPSPPAVAPLDEEL